MKRQVFYLLLFVLVSPAFAAKGTVVLRKDDCDYFIVQTARNDYALFEWIKGYDPVEGDELVGDFESYGMEQINCITADKKLSVFVIDYRLSLRKATEKLNKECEDD